MPVIGLTDDNDFIGDTYKRLKVDQAYARVTDNHLNIVAIKAKKFRDSIMHTPTIRPIAVDSIYAISSFGLRMHPILHKLKMHDGIDYAALVGTPVHATANGKVVAARYDKISGLYVKIDHGYHYTTLYAHLSKIYVHTGQEVRKGQIIGLVGNTGRSVGPHLHYEVRINQVPVNPVRFIDHKIDAERQCLVSSKKSKSIVIAR
jgi:murein DD-endopeptidase MepM/ murein hydrolase activator NlpD